MKYRRATFLHYPTPKGWRWVAYVEDCMLFEDAFGRAVWGGSVRLGVRRIYGPRPGDDEKMKLAAARCERRLRNWAGVKVVWTEVLA